MSPSEYPATFTRWPARSRVGASSNGIPPIRCSISLFPSPVTSTTATCSLPVPLRTSCACTTPLSCSRWLRGFAGRFTFHLRFPCRPQFGQIDARGEQVATQNRALGIGLHCHESNLCERRACLMVTRGPVVLVVRSGNRFGGFGFGRRSRNPGGGSGGDLRLRDAARHAVNLGGHFELERTSRQLRQLFRRELHATGYARLPNERA